MQRCSRCPGRCTCERWPAAPGSGFPTGTTTPSPGLLLARLGRLPQIGDEISVPVELVRADDSDLPPRGTVALRVQSLAGRTVGDVLLTVHEAEARS